jgi:RNA polymerase sigma-70 factor, ECF subfamily
MSHQERKHAGVAVGPGGGNGAPEGASASVTRLPVLASATDAEILIALTDRRPVGGAALYDRYRRLVRRILLRLLGSHHDLNDLVQEAFVAVIRTIGRVTGPEALRPWITSVAVFTARDELRRRRRRRFLVFLADDVPDVEAPASPPEAKEALRATYRILSTLPADERIAFALRFIEGMELTEVAAACRVSLATVKRRVARAKSTFEAQAGHHPSLAPWLEGW